MEIGNWEINYFPDFNFQREIENARNALYFTRILYRGNIFLCPGGTGNVVFYLYKPLARRRVYKTRRLYAIRDVPTFCIGTVIAMWEILEEDKSPWRQNYCE